MRQRRPQRGHEEAAEHVAGEVPAEASAWRSRRRRRRRPPSGGDQRAPARRARRARRTARATSRAVACPLGHEAGRRGCRRAVGGPRVGERRLEQLRSSGWPRARMTGTTAAVRGRPRASASATSAAPRHDEGQRVGQGRRRPRRAPDRPARVRGRRNPSAWRRRASALPPGRRRRPQVTTSPARQANAPAARWRGAGHARRVADDGSSGLKRTDFSAARTNPHPRDRGRRRGRGRTAVTTSQ